MTKCKRMINGKCWGYDGINCSEYCPGYDTKFDAKKCVLEMVKYGSGKDLKEHIKKQFDTTLKDFGDEALNILGTTDFEIIWKEATTEARHGKTQARWSAQDTERARELRKAGLTMRNIAAQLGYGYSTVQKYTRIAGIK